MPGFIAAFQLEHVTKLVVPDTSPDLIFCMKLGSCRKEDYDLFIVSRQFFSSWKPHQNTSVFFPNKKKKVNTVFMLSNMVETLFCSAPLGSRWDKKSWWEGHADCASDYWVKIGLDLYELQEFKSMLCCDTWCSTLLLNEWPASAMSGVHVCTETYMEQMAAKYFHLTCEGT